MLIVYMQFVSHYQSPIGPVTLVAEGDALVGAWFNDQRFFGSTLTPSAVAGVMPVLNDAAGSTTISRECVRNIFRLFL